MNFIKQITPKGWIIIGVVILIIILIIYFARKPKTITTIVKNPVVPPANTNTTTTSTGNNFPLHKGSVGDNVKKWQTYLNTKGAGLVIDGIWGNKTEAASIKYMGFNQVEESYFKGLGL